MVPPNFLSLPILPNFDLIVVVIVRLLVVLEVLLADGETSPAVCILENVLALRNVLVSLELPENGPAVIASTGKKGANVVPPDTVNRLFVIGQLSQFPDLFDFVLVEKTLHCLDIALEVAIEFDAGLVGPVVLRDLHLSKCTNQ